MKKTIFGLLLAFGMMTASVSFAAGEIDINSATKAELIALKGIVDARADALIKGRP